MPLDSKDLERIERIIHKNGDDIAVCYERGLERVEERIDGMKTRIYGRLAELEDKLESRNANYRESLDE